MRSASAVLVSLLLSSRIGFASEAVPPPATLTVRAAPDCTSEADLIARVSARSPRIRFVDDDAAFAVRAQFTPLRSGSVAGEVVLTGPGGKPSSRRIVARSCTEAADAIALIVAVTLDPASASDRQAGTAENAETPRDPQLVNQPPVPGADPAAPASSPIDSPPEPAITRRRLGLYLAAQSIFGPAPAIMPGIAAYVLVGLDREALWSPALILGVAHDISAGVEAWGGTAFFTLDAASLDACAIRVRLSVIEARGCGTALVGRLAARGTDTQNAAGTVARPFAALGGSVVFIAGVGRIMELSARMGAGANLVRDSFEFAPMVFHKVHPATLSASLGIGLRLP